MINLDLPEPYLRAIAARVTRGFDLLPTPRQQDLLAEIKGVAVLIAVNARKLSEYSDWELLVKNAFTELPVDKWEADWGASMHPVPPKSEKPTAPVAAPKKEKK